MVDLGKPGRLLNILLYPAPSSLMFWDCLTLGG
jgi:molybdopterin-containing oxidoreductase family membrane subunit